MKNPFNFSSQPERQPHAEPEASRSDRVELAPVAAVFAAMEHEGSVGALLAMRSLFPSIKSPEGIYDPTQPATYQDTVHPQAFAGNYTVAQTINEAPQLEYDREANPDTFFDEPWARDAAADHLYPMSQPINGVGAAAPYIGEVVAAPQITSEAYVKGLSDLGTIDMPLEDAALDNVNSADNVIDLRTQRVDAARHNLDSIYEQGAAA